ncbi:hypothetical protein Tco_0025802 [Tanacetum coccineum]
MSEPSISQPQGIRVTTFVARVRITWQSTHERMERFGNHNFQASRGVNGFRRTEMFGFSKNSQTSREPLESIKKRRSQIPRHQNVGLYSFLSKGKTYGSNKTKVTPDNAEKLAETETESRHFVILDIRENKNRPFIFGTPFLTTAKASIKFDTGTITLRSGKHKISFHRVPNSSNVTNKGVRNDIEPIAPTMTVNSLVLEWEEKIKLHLEREMQFNQWRSKNFKGKHPTLTATKEGMDDK